MNIAAHCLSLCSASPFSITTLTWPPVLILYRRHANWIFTAAHVRQFDERYLAVLFRPPSMNLYRKCSVTYFRSFASRPNPSVCSMHENVADEAGSLSMKGRRRHQERSSSPKKQPGSSTFAATLPLLRLWLRPTSPQTMNIILCTGSPSLMICFFFFG